MYVDVNNIELPDWTRSRRNWDEMSTCLVHAQNSGLYSSCAVERRVEACVVVAPHKAMESKMTICQ